MIRDQGCLPCTLRAARLAGGSARATTRTLDWAVCMTAAARRPCLLQAGPPKANKPSAPGRCPMGHKLKEITTPEDGEQLVLALADFGIFALAGIALCMQTC